MANSANRFSGKMNIVLRIPDPGRAAAAASVAAVSADSLARSLIPVIADACGGGKLPTMPARIPAINAHDLR
jgi:hypothetical protein